MRQIIYLLCISLLIASCGGTKKKYRSTNSSTSKQSNTRYIKPSKKAKSIIQYAKTFQGTKYKYGGTTRKGMDCSGLIYTSFKKEAVVLPRTSRAMSTQGQKVALKKVAPGDLLFFKTNKNKNVVNHVGLVVAVGKDILFIHSSSSKGVTISSLQERYWNGNFVSARRVL